MKRSRYALWALAAAGWLGAIVSGAVAQEPEPGSRYREVLELVAGGESGAALELLGTVESASADAGGSGLDRFRQIQLDLVAALDPAGASYLLPVYGLHERAYVATREEVDSEAAAHARTMMAELAELYLARAWTFEQRATAADLFASLGGYWRSFSSGPAGTEFFRRSLRLDRTNEAALIGQGAGFEQRGRFKEALRYLRRMPVASHEGQLRLGINQGRAQSKELAISTLRPLLERPAPDWVLVLAYQALARLLMDEGRADQALATLRGGLERYPDDGTLALALAYLEEREGGAESERVLEALEAGMRSTGRPPRFRYSRDPVQSLTTVRERLAREVEKAVPALRKALEAHGGAEAVGVGAVHPGRRTPSVRVGLALSAEEPISVRITQPDPEAAIFGEVEIAAEVAADEPIERVEFFVDGVLVATDREAPYRARFDAGTANVDRLFRVVAHAVSGRQGEATVATRKVAIDDQVELSLMQLYVTASRGDEAVLDLDRDDFRIFDDGVEQQIVTFERGDLPMTAVLLVDASASMEGPRLEAAMAAARELKTQLGELDEAMVVVFSDHTLSVTRFERGATPVEMTGFAPAGGTALNDHLYAALRLLDPRQGRPVVILLSDGADTLSFLRMEDLAWKLQRSDAVLFRVRPEGSPKGRMVPANSWRSPKEAAAEVEGLAQAIAESGGRVRLAPLDGLEEAIGAVVEELRQQYVLGYYTTEPRRDGRWRPVRVEVQAPEVVTRTRSGYIDE